MLLTRLSDPQEIQDALDRTTIDPTRPVLVGVGPVEAATTMALEPYPSIVYDTNLFYRDMGVHFRASRVEIRRAFVELDGPNSVRLMMIAGVLLNPERRLAYDRVPMSAFFFDDEIEGAMRIRASTEASQVRADGGEVDEDGLNDALDEMRKPIDSMDDLPSFTDRYPWSYYLKNSTHNDTELLSLWRDAIITALWSQYPLDRPTRLGVGWVGQGEADFEVVRVGYRMVCLVSEGLEFSLPAVLQAARLLTQPIQ